MTLSHKPAPGHGQGSGGSSTSPFWLRYDAELRRLADDGLTTAQAAHRLGVTKNAVIGRGQRIGVVWKRTPAARPDMPERAPRKPAFEFPPPGRCVFPHGHPKEPDFHFCGDEVVERGEPYCASHFLIAYRPQPQQREAA